jgi:cold shock CspA family protein
MSERERGRVQRWNGCFGWISRGPDLPFVFVHRSDVATDRKRIYVGCEVEFSIEEAPKGVKAVNVTLVKEN